MHKSLNQLERERMKKRGIAQSINLSESKGKFEQANKSLPIKMKQIIIAVFILVFIIPLNKQVMADKDIKPGKRQATLILSDGRKIALGYSSDTIVHSKIRGLRIKIDSCGVNYIVDGKKILKQSNSKTAKKEKVVVNNE